MERFFVCFPPPVCELVQTLPSISHCGLKERTETASFQNDWSAVFMCLLVANDVYCLVGTLYIIVNEVTATS